MNKYKIISLMLFLELLLISSRILHSDNSPHSIEFQVTASCQPHSYVESYRNMSLLLNFSNDSQASPTIQGVLSLDGREKYESQKADWTVPQPHWLSLVFEGPRVQMTTYCEEGSRFHSLHLSYLPKQGMKMFVNDTADYGGRELDTIGETNNNLIPIHAEGKYLNEYRVGRDTSFPYWVQISLSQQSLSHGEASTNLRYQFP